MLDTGLLMVLCYPDSVFTPNQLSSGPTSQEEVSMQMHIKRIKLMAVGFALSLCTFEVAISAGNAAEGVYRIASATSVAISARMNSGSGKTGSGVIVAANLILTNCHVVNGANDLEITFFDKEKVAASLSNTINDADLCLLSAATGSRKGAKIGSKASLKVGQDVYAIGNPLSLSDTFTNGIISAIRTAKSESLIQITAAISPGSSGGGLFDLNGNLIGITTSSLTRGQNLNFAIPIDVYTKWKVNSKNSASSLIESKLTFKGVPMGASIGLFKEKFTRATCDLMGILTICSEQNVDFLGKTGHYQAMFKSNKMYYVHFTWLNQSDPRQAAKEIRNKVEEYFGAPTKSDSEIEQLASEKTDVAQWDLSEFQSIALGYCKAMDLGCVLGRGAILTLKDRRFDAVETRPKSKERDF